MGEGGYVAEFVYSVWKPLMKEIMKRGVKVITNAGGLNPLKLKEAIEEASISEGVHVVVAAVVGDDLYDQFSELDRNNYLHPFVTGCFYFSFRFSFFNIFMT